jgi:hypothetical protein
MAKPFILGVPMKKSDRVADLNYVRVQTNGVLPKVLVVPGLEQNRAPSTSDDPLPPLPFMRDPVPWRFR